MTAFLSDEKAGLVLKLCKKCGCETQRDKAGGCMPCSRARGRRWAQKNKEEKKAANLEYYAKNKDKKLGISRAWKLANPEMVKAAAKARRQRPLKDGEQERRKASIAAWKAKNPGAIRASEAARRARKRGAGGRHSSKDVQKLLLLQRYMCAVCRASIREKRHVDHIMPLALGGSNDPSNLQLLCPSCNCSKHAKHPVDFMQSRGFLL